jgi:hypothetical protein
MKIIKSMGEFNTLLQQTMLVVLAKTKTCSVCGPIASRLDQVMTLYPNVAYYHIYIEDVEEFSGQHLVFTVPTILMYAEGKELLRESRFVNFDNINRLLSIYHS